MCKLNLSKLKTVNRTRIATVAVLSAVAAYAAGTAVYAVIHLARSAELARGSKPFEKNAVQGGPRLLIVGDSTAEGTGASAPRNSLAGLMSRANPALTIVNRGRDGARFKDVLEQLEGGGRYDCVLVLAGGNDVIRMTSTRSLGKAVEAVAHKARALADSVVFMPAGNVGNAPFFLPPWRWLMARRSARLHAIVADAALRTGARYVDLYQRRENDPFALAPDRMNAVDGLHPSDAGYALWHRELESQARLSHTLASQRG